MNLKQFFNKNKKIIIIVSLLLITLLLIIFLYFSKNNEKLDHETKKFSNLSVVDENLFKVSVSKEIG